MLELLEYKDTKDHDKFSDNDDLEKVCEEVKHFVPQKD